MKIDTAIMTKWSSRLTLGIEKANGLVFPLIYRGSTIPTMSEEVFYLSGNFNPQIWNRVASVRIIEGERPRARDSGNRLVGILEIPLPQCFHPGYPTIEVNFNLDTSDNLTVTVTDLTSMNEVRTVFSRMANITHAERDTLVRIAQKNAPEDRAKAAIQSAIVSGLYLYEQIEAKYLKNSEVTNFPKSVKLGLSTSEEITSNTPYILQAPRTDINPLIFEKITMCISAIDGALSQEITKIASGQQQVWRDKCSQTIVLLSNAELELIEMSLLIRLRETPTSLDDL